MGDFISKLSFEFGEISSSGQSIFNCEDYLVRANECIYWILSKTSWSTARDLKTPRAMKIRILP